MKPEMNGPLVRNRPSGCTPAAQSWNSDSAMPIAMIARSTMGDRGAVARVGAGGAGRLAWSMVVCPDQGDGHLASCAAAADRDTTLSPIVSM